MPTRFSLVPSEEQPTAVSETDRLTRRAFCTLACQAATVVAAGGLAACGGSDPSSPSGNFSKLASVNSTVSGSTVSVVVDAASPLNPVGGLATTQSSRGTFLLARLSDTSFSALTAICTHEQCTVTEFTGSQFHCPCHGSQYTTSGAVTQGPAPRALTSFPTQFSGGVLTFTA